MSGLKEAAISKLMAEEGYTKISERTVQRLLASATAHQMADELINLQLADITRADIALRLKWRSDAIHILKPTPLININQQQIDMDVKKVEFTYEGFMGKYGKAFAEQLLREESDEDRSPDGSDTQQPIRPP